MLNDIVNKIVNSDSEQDVEEILNPLSKDTLIGIAKSLDVLHYGKNKDKLRIAIINATVVAKNRSNAIRNFNLR